MKVSTIIPRFLVHWFDSDRIDPKADNSSEKIEWARLAPFILIHAACLLVFYVGFSWTALYIAIGSYLVRMFAITGFYHRYFSHRTFKTNRFWQLLFGILATSSSQRGPLWWAAHHREHHKVSDHDVDVHTPVKRSFLWSHMGWICCQKNFYTNYKTVKDFAKFPELVFINRFDILAPLAYGTFIYLLGLLLSQPQFGLDITAGQTFVWGFIVSTVVLFHATFTINSLAHIYGKKRFNTPDNSRNNFWLALLTLGEGWHNNHHHFPHSTRQGFYWWEIDITYYFLKLMSFLRIISDLKPVPEHIKKTHTKGKCS